MSPRTPTGLSLGRFDRVVGSELGILTNVQLCWEVSLVPGHAGEAWQRTPQFLLFCGSRLLYLPGLHDILPEDVSDLPDQLDLLLKLFCVYLRVVRQDLATNL